MANNNRPSYPKILLPRAPAVFPKLNVADTKFDADGVYETKLRYGNPEEAVDGLRGKTRMTLPEILELAVKVRDEFLEEKRAELMTGDGKAKKKAKEITARDIGEPELDDATGDETGGIILKVKMKASGKYKSGPKTGQTWERKPELFDGQGKSLGKKPPLIYGGSLVKCAVELFPYYAANENAVGVTLRLEAVQVIELVTGGQRNASAYGFGAEDGGYAVDDSAGEVDDSDADGDAGDTSAEEDF
ncbi:hypothetical protein [Stenotrophomonas oahuensis]|uniref:Single-stranded DNA-binding protein BPT7 domain-containing protein n=1 Tax=Stenotrophomonas oahuensis TaxID=3003271 RepID=A0ABY9YPA2_9GAMM|nr:hypothetical protein [Stenotrophomonas sp. A5586]WNH52455.1 hypothetical protein PDM29_19385 [Stenotrophomonas sp. A5586]